MGEELYFKDPQTGEMKLAKRAEDNLVMSVLKLNKEREDIKKELQSSHTLFEAKFSMFETLLRERLDHIYKEIESVREDNKKDNLRLTEQVKGYATSLVDRQKTINDIFEGKFKENTETLTKHEEQLDILEQKETKQKAKIFDKITWTILGALIAVILNFLKSLIGGT